MKPRYYIASLLIILLVQLIPATSIVAYGEEKPKLDMVFVIDVTGSMRDDIAAVKERVRDIVSNLGNVDARLALITFKDWPCCGYGDPGDYPAMLNLNFTRNKDLFIEKVMELSVKGGGDTPESQLFALWVALTKLDWRPEAYKVIVLLTDAPFHDPSPDPCVLANCLEMGIENGGLEIPLEEIASLDIHAVQMLRDAKKINIVYVMLPTRSELLAEEYRSIGEPIVYEDAGRIVEEVTSKAVETAKYLALIKVAGVEVSPRTPGENLVKVILKNYGNTTGVVKVSAYIDDIPCLPDILEASIVPLGSESLLFKCVIAPGAHILRIYVNSTLAYTEPVEVGGIAANETLLEKIDMLISKVEELSRKIDELEARIKMLEERQSILEEMLMNLSSCQPQVKWIPLEAGKGYNVIIIIVASNTTRIPLPI